MDISQSEAWFRQYFLTHELEIKNPPYIFHIMDDSPPGPDFVENVVSLKREYASVNDLVNQMNIPELRDKIEQSDDLIELSPINFILPGRIIVIEKDENGNKRYYVDCYLRTNDLKIVRQIYDLYKQGKLI